MKQFKKNNNIKHKISEIIVYVILLILVSILLAYVIQIFINRNKTPNIFGYKFYTVISGSMEPELNIGDAVIVKQSENAQKGEMIAYRKGSIVIIHRVIDIVNDGGEIKYITKGDKNNVRDELFVCSDQIEGIYVIKIKFIGYLLIWIRKYLVYLVSGIIIIVLIRKLIKNIKE